MKTKVDFNGTWVKDGATVGFTQKALVYEAADLAGVKNLVKQALYDFMNSKGATSLEVSVTVTEVVETVLTQKTVKFTATYPKTIVNDL